MLIYSLIALAVFFTSLFVLKQTKLIKGRDEEDKIQLLILVFFCSLVWILALPVVIAGLIACGIMYLGMKVIS